MALAVRQQHDFLAGITVEKLLRIPRYSADGSRADGDLWINSTDNVLRFREDGTTYTLGMAGALDAEQVRDIIGATLVAGNNIDIVVDDGGDTVTIAVEALTAADISDFQSTARAAISVTDTASLDLTYNSSTGVLSGAVLDSPSVSGANLASLRSFDLSTGTRAATSALTQATARLLGRISASSGAVEELTADQVTTFLDLATTDIANFAADVVTAVNAANNIDADTLGGDNKSAIITAAIAGVVDAAPTTLDTLNELAAALGDDPNFATTVSNNLASKARFFNVALGAGSTSATHAHGLGTEKLIVQVRVDATGRYEDYDIVTTSTNVVVTDETGGNIPSGRTLLVVAAA